jgi:hypothetical protein
MPKNMNLNSRDALSKLKMASASTPIYILALRKFLKLLLRTQKDSKEAFQTFYKQLLMRKLIKKLPQGSTSFYKLPEGSKSFQKVPQSSRRFY